MERSWASLFWGSWLRVSPDQVLVAAAVAAVAAAAFSAEEKDSGMFSFQIKLFVLLIE